MICVFRVLLCFCFPQCLLSVTATQARVLDASGQTVRTIARGDNSGAGAGGAGDDGTCADAGADDVRMVFSNALTVTFDVVGWRLVTIVDIEVARVQFDVQSGGRLLETRHVAPPVRRSKNHAATSGAAAAMALDHGSLQVHYSYTIATIREAHRALANPPPFNIEPPFHLPLVSFLWFSSFLFYREAWRVS